MSGNSSRYNPHITYRDLFTNPNDHPDALQRLGIAAVRRDDFDLAIAYFRKALAVSPSDAHIYSNLGEALRRAGKPEQAIHALSDAVKLSPTLAEAHFNLGSAQFDARRLREAAESFGRAIQIRPSYVNAFIALGNTYRESAQLEQAVRAYRRATELSPEYAEAHNNLALALLRQGRVGEAISTASKATSLKPSYAEAYTNLGNALYQAGHLDKAIDAHLRAIGLKPNLAEAHNNLGVAYRESGQLDQAMLCFRRAVDANPNLVLAASNLVYTLWFHPSFDTRAIYEEHRQWAEKYETPLRNSITVPNHDRRVDRRLKIGYVSPDFRKHPVGQFIVPVLERHDPANVEVFCYSSVQCPDPLTDKVRSLADHWRVASGFTDSELATQIRADNIDVLVDLTLHCEGSRLLTFARRAAPVQVTWLGYPGTTGLRSMDFRITDPHLDPPGTSDSFYSEQSIRLPHCFWCYQPMVEAPPVGPSPAAKCGHVTFGSFNNFGKVTQRTLDVWIRMLQVLHNSRLLLYTKKGAHRELIKGKFCSAGVELSRLDLIDQEPIERYLARHDQVDIALDPFPFSGATTTCDSLWMGVPVITLAGGTVVGRAGVSLLNNLGLNEWIAQTEDQYVSIAEQMARDLPTLCELRSDLRTRMLGSALMNADQFARDLEVAYREMWRRRCVSEDGHRTDAPQAT